MSETAQEDIVEINTEPQIVSASEEDMEIEVLDDRPMEDRVPPRAEAEPAPSDEGEDDEAADYSERVQKRIKKLKYDYHEERRAKDAADREREEAVGFAQKVFEENQKLRNTLAQGEGVLLEQTKGRAEAEVARAKKEYKDAFESGDPDAITEAQMSLTNAQAAAIQANQYEPVYQNIPAPTVSQKKVERPINKPTNLDVEWAENNPWFNRDSVMTGFALGVHEELIKSGTNPLENPQEYYRQLDAELQKRFPDKFGGGSIEQAPRSQAGNVVAPAQRSANKSRKVQLTSTQVALAKRIGITPEQYAAQLLKLEQ
jgi:hypothetical protein